MKELYLVYKITNWNGDLFKVEIGDKAYDNIHVAYSDSIIRKYFNKRNAGVMDEETAAEMLSKCSCYPVANREIKDYDEDDGELNIIEEFVYIKKIKTISV